MPQEMRFFTQDETLKNQEEHAAQRTTADELAQPARRSGPASSRYSAPRRNPPRRRWLDVLVLVVAAVFIIFVLVLVFTWPESENPSSAAQGANSTGANSAVSEPAAPASEPEPTPEPTPALPAAPAVSRDDWFVALVTNQQPIPEGYDPATDAVDPAGYYFDARAAQQVLDMMDAAAAEGLQLKVNSGFRSVDRQRQNHELAVATQRAAGLDAEQAELAAQRIQPNAGYSEHNLGLAVDFVTHYNHRQTEFVQSPEFQWLTQHAVEYGFVLRYPEDKQEITGMEYKPWHWRYVGQELAVFFNEQGLTLDEFHSLYLS